MRPRREEIVCESPLHCISIRISILSDTRQWSPLSTSPHITSDSLSPNSQSYGRFFARYSSHRRLRFSSPIPNPTHGSDSAIFLKPNPAVPLLGCVSYLTIIKQNIRPEKDRRRLRETMEKERELQLYLARLAEQAERYDGMLSFFSLFFFFGGFTEACQFL